LVLLVPGVASAISRPLRSASLPWGDRLASEGLELRVAVEPVDRRAHRGYPDTVLRARDRVAFEFRIFDEGGRPIQGLRPAAWMERLAEGETVDPSACVQEMETGSGWSLVRTPALDLDLREGERPGTYQAVARLGRPGRYEVAFFLGSPRLVHCFEVEIQQG
ncbi:MAG TPA: hypothetical protein VL025_02815, partial [Thermoanaerobaculia bacterium]|nr:hypothetical protein [Thermoanaerobaculia bacterium]